MTFAIVEWRKLWVYIKACLSSWTWFRIFNFFQNLTFILLYFCSQKYQNLWWWKNLFAYAHLLIADFHLTQTVFSPLVPRGCKPPTNWFSFLILKTSTCHSRAGRNLGEISHSDEDSGLDPWIKNPKPVLSWLGNDKLKVSQMKIPVIPHYFLLSLKIL